MALYFGSGEKVIFNFDNKLYCLNLYSSTPITNGIRLKSVEDFILKDKNGLYLTTKDGD